MAAVLCSEFLSEKRYAVVTGANKGIGFEICRQLASKGVVVILTARDENRGKEAVKKLKSEDLPVEFHQLDVGDPASVASLAQFIETQFGKLDILVNNAGVFGSVVKNWESLMDSVEKPQGVREEVNYEELVTETYELAEECINTNYYGCKRTTEALLPLLLSSNSGRIVNVSSSAGVMMNLLDEWAKGVLSNVEDLNEEKIDQVLDEFLKDFKVGNLAKKKRWCITCSAYVLSKVAMNAYTRIMSRVCHPRLDINAVCPGYVRTDITSGNGVLSAKEGAESPVRLAILGRGESSGLFYIRGDVSSF